MSKRRIGVFFALVAALLLVLTACVKTDDGENRVYNDPAADPGNCFRASVCVCPSCEASNYLTVSHLTVVHKGGETQQNEEKFVNALWVPTEVVEQVKDLADRWSNAHSPRPEQLASASDAGDAVGEDPAEVV